MVNLDVKGLPCQVNGEHRNIKVKDRFGFAVIQLHILQLDQLDRRLPGRCHAPVRQVQGRFRREGTIGLQQDVLVFPARRHLDLDVQDAHQVLEVEFQAAAFIDSSMERRHEVISVQMLERTVPVLGLIEETERNLRGAEVKIPDKRRIGGIGSVGFQAPAATVKSGILFSGMARQGKGYLKTGSGKDAQCVFIGPYQLQVAVPVSDYRCFGGGGGSFSQDFTPE